MLTAEQIAALGDRAEEITRPITEYLIQDIARRVAKAGQLTSTAAYQIWQAQLLGTEQKKIKAQLQKLLDKSAEEIEILLKQAAEVGYDFDLSRLPTADAIPFAENENLQQIVDAAAKLARADFTNLVQTLGTVAPNGKCVGLTDAYIKCSDFAFEQVFTGATDYNTAVRQAIKQLAEKGIRIIDYENGRHYSMEAAVRRNFMGGMGLLQEKISQQNHDSFGANGWEISAHGASAPDHEPIQGKQYSDEAYKNLNKSLVRRIGTLNCGHAAFGVILGESEPRFTDEELQQMRDDNAKGFNYEGQHYTLYKATQQQRKIECAMRKCKNRILADEAAGDTEQLQADRIRLGRLNEAYEKFSKAADLPTQRERMYVGGFGRKQAAQASGAYRKTLDTSKKDVILKDINLSPIPVTADSIRKVKAFPCETLSVKQQIKLQSEHKKLLLSVSSKPLGTEAGATFTLDMQPIHKTFGKDSASSVSIPHEKVPYIAMHTHPTGGTFTHTDLRNFAKDEKMCLLTAVGNNGVVYAVEKTKDFSFALFNDKYQEVLNQNIDFIEAPEKYVKFIEEFMKGCNEIGIRYYTGAT